MEGHLLQTGHRLKRNVLGKAAVWGKEGRGPNHGKEDLAWGGPTRLQKSWRE